MGNPKKRRSSRRSHRRHHRRSSRSSIFRNPIGGSVAAVMGPAKEMISKQFLVEASSLALGFVLPGIVTSKFVPASYRNTAAKGYAVKVAVIAGLAGATSLWNKRVSKAILMGGGVSLVLDIYTDFVAPMLGGVLGAASAPAALPAPAGGTATYYGDRGVGTFYGDNGLGAYEGASIGSAFGGAGDNAYA
ncbi:MAG TPA: hypothetical protein VN915_06765 [Elusimicrobiota bacterium]|nr:hypothetical protein [Elusimicrobiota bacterium]